MVAHDLSLENIQSRFINDMTKWVEVNEQKLYVSQGFAVDCACNDLKTILQQVTYTIFGGSKTLFSIIFHSQGDRSNRFKTQHHWLLIDTDSTVGTNGGDISVKKMIFLKSFIGN